MIHHPTRRTTTLVRPIMLRHYNRRTRPEWEAAFAQCENVVDTFRELVHTAKTGRSSTGQQLYSGPAPHVSVVVERLGDRTENAVRSVLDLAAAIRERHDADLANLQQVIDAPLPPPTGDEIAQRAYYGTVVAATIDGLTVEQVLSIATEQAESPAVLGSPQYGAAWADRLQALAEQHTRKFNTDSIPKMLDLTDAQKLNRLAQRLRAPSLPPEAQTAHTDRGLLAEVDQLTTFVERSARVRLEGLVTRQSLDATVDRFVGAWRLGQLIPRGQRWTRNFDSVDELANAMNNAYGVRSGTTGIWRAQ